MTRPILIDDPGGQAGPRDARALLTYRGAPVWPAPTAEDRAALEELVALFGGSIQRVRAVEGGRIALRKGMVVGVGRGVADAARLYAHLTRRALRLVKSTARLMEGPAPSVVVLDYRALDGHVLRWLALPRMTDAPGVICASGARDLHRQVLLRAAAARLRGPGAALRVNVVMMNERWMAAQRPGSLVDGGFGAEAGSPSGAPIVDRSAPPERIKEALGAKAGVLLLHDHSDGLDADLGPGLTLCPLDRAPAPADIAGEPRCWVTRACYRRRRPIDEALASGELLPPEAIAARIFVWDSCRGIMLPRGDVDPKWALGERLFASATLGAVILPWETVVPNEEIERLCRALERGVPAGRALGLFLRARASREIGHRLCLFGDPAVRACAPARRKFARSGPRRWISAAETHEQIADIGLVRACVGDHAGTGAEGLGPIAARALDRAQAHERFEWACASIEARAEGPGEAFRADLLEYLLHRDAFYDDWPRYGIWEEEDDTSRRCRVCREALKVLIAALRIPGVGRRRFASCPRCDVVEDAPIASRLALTCAGDRALRLSGPLPKDQWKAGVLTNTWGVTARWPWPAGADGRPARRVELPGGAPPYPTRIAFFLVHRCTITMLVTRARGARALACRELKHARRRLSPAIAGPSGAGSGRDPPAAGT